MTNATQTKQGPGSMAAQAALSSNGSNKSVRSAINGAPLATWTGKVVSK